MGLNPITTTDAFLAQISGQLDELIAIVRPEPPAEPEPVKDPAPATGEPKQDKPKPKAPAKKTATRRRVTGQ